MKSVLRHTVSVDRRDEPIFPTRGAFVSFSSEVCGLGGGVAHLRNELRAQHNAPLAGGACVLQVGAAAGVLHDVFGTELPDRLFLGGPTSVRGFRQRGVGPHGDGLACGGRAYWAAAVHAYAPLPFRPGSGGGGGGLGSLFRSHVFVNAGSLAGCGGGGDALWAALGEARVACGAGVALRLGRVARLELNYCVPLRAAPHDVRAPGLQFGVGAHFL